MIKIYWIVVWFFLYNAAFSQTYDAELISQKTTIEISRGKLTKDVHYEIRINNRAGEAFTNISIPFSKLLKVSNIEGYIKDSNGSIVKKLKKSDILERSSIADFSFYDDSFVKEFTLKHNTYPYTILYSYQIQQNEYLIIDGWVPVIDEDLPTLSASLEVSIPINYKISYKEQLVDNPIIDTVENTIKFKWNALYTDIKRSEKYSPSILKFLPMVLIVPTDFSYNVPGSFKNWITFGNWINELLEGLNDLPDTEKIRIQALIENVDDEKEIIRILYHYLQDETRYINVTIETGGLKPYPASYVAYYKYGDCKALSNYFKSMLDYVNITSYYTTVYAGSPNREIDIDFPFQPFNHIILYVPLKNEDIWLDCTTDGAFNYLGTFTQNRDALVITKDESKFVKTPALKPRESLVIRNIGTTLDSNSTHVRFNNIYWGESYELLFQVENTFSDREKSRFIHNTVGDGFQLIDYKIHSTHRDSAKIGLSYNATTSNIYKHYGNDILIANIAFSMPLFNKPTERKLPVQIDFPIYKIDTISYQIPKGYKLDNHSFSFSVNTKYGEYNINTYKNEEKVVTTKSLLINAGYYPIEEYKDFYDFYFQIVESENKTRITLSK